MATMTIFDQRVEVECGDAVSEHGVPYATREFEIRRDQASCYVEVRMYPKTTTIVVTECPDVVSSGNVVRDYYETGWLCRVPTATYKANAVVEIEKAIRIKDVEERTGYEDNEWRDILNPDEGDK